MTDSQFYWHQILAARTGAQEGKKNDYEANHALWNQYDMLHPTIFSSWRQESPPINFILQKKKSAMGLTE